MTLSNKLVSLLCRITDLNLSGKGTAASDLFSQSFRKRFGTCPVCTGEFAGHSYAALAMALVGEGSATDLISKIRNHQWAAAFAIQEFEGSRDVIIAYCLRCPSKRVAMVLVEDPFELYFNPMVVDFEVLDHESSEQVTLLLDGSKWYPVL